MRMVAACRIQSNLKQLAWRIEFHISPTSPAAVEIVTLTTIQIAYLGVNYTHQRYSENTFIPCTGKAVCANFPLQNHTILTDART